MFQESVAGFTRALWARRPRPWQTVYDWFNKWQKLGIIERVLVKFQVRLQQDGFISLDARFVDSTVTRAHKAAAGAKKKNKEAIRKH